MTRSAFALGILFVFIGFAAGAARAQGPVIAELQIAVQDLATKKKLEPVSPGETLKLEVGQRVRLRLVAIPAGRHQAPRYPSARFTALAGKRRIAVIRIDEKEGSAIIEAVRTDHPGNPKAVTLIQHEILEPMNIRPGLMKGTITIVVIEKAAEESTRPGQETRRGVWLYEHEDFRGKREFFSYDDPRLADNRIVRGDMASSVKVDSGCKATLFQDSGFRGRVSVLTRDEPSLGRTRVGNDRVSSLKIECEKP